MVKIDCGKPRKDSTGERRTIFYTSPEGAKAIKAWAKSAEYQATQAKEAIKFVNNKNK